MQRVLLTRPQSDSEKLARALAQHHYKAVIEPLLEIVPFKAPTPSFGNLQAIMATSAHAFMFADKNVFAKAGLLTLPCYGVGKSTTDAARAFGFDLTLSADGDGQALAEKMIRERDAAQGTILHLTGRDSEGGAAAALKSAGFRVEPWILYAAEKKESFSKETLALFREGKIDAALIFSTRTAEAFAAAITTHRLESACTSMVGLAISDAVRQNLAALPWQKLAAAAQPTEDAVLQRLYELLPEV